MAEDIKYCARCDCNPCLCFGNYEPGKIVRIRKRTGTYPQSRKGSLLEVSCSTLVGYLIALLTQYLIFPVFGIHTSGSDNMLIALIFTIVSIIRGYVFRRVFNSLCK